MTRNLHLNSLADVGEWMSASCWLVLLPYPDEQTGGRPRCWITHTVHKHEWIRMCVYLVQRLMQLGRLPGTGIPGCQNPYMQILYSGPSSAGQPAFLMFPWVLPGTYTQTAMPAAVEAGKQAPSGSSHSPHADQVQLPQQLQIGQVRYIFKSQPGDCTHTWTISSSWFPKAATLQVWAAVTVAQALVEDR